MPPRMHPEDPLSQKRTGEGPEGHGGEWVSQNLIATKGELNRSYLEYLHGYANSVGIFPKAHGPTYYRLGRNDFAVTPSIKHPRLVSGSTRRPPVHSVFNGDGVDEVAAYPNRPDLQMAALLDRFQFAGVAYDTIDLVRYDDTGRQESVGLAVAGSTTHQAPRDIYTGAIIMLRLPRPDERVMRRTRDDPGTVKLIPDIKTPETTWNLVSSAVKRYIFELTDNPETRLDRGLRQIDPSRNAHEAFADAIVVFGLEFMKVLMDYDIIRVQHPAREAVPDHFSFRPAAAGSEAIGGNAVLLGLAQAFGVIPREVKVDGAEFTLRRMQAFHRLRKVLTGVAFYDGTTRNHAFHTGMAGVDPVMSLQAQRQTPAHRVTQAQIDTPRNLVAAVDDLLTSANKWTIGTALQGAKKEFPFRLHLK